MLHEAVHLLECASRVNHLLDSSTDEYLPVVLHQSLWVILNHLQLVGTLQGGFSAEHRAVQTVFQLTEVVSQGRIREWHTTIQDAIGEYEDCFQAAEAMALLGDLVCKLSIPVRPFSLLPQLESNIAFSNPLLKAPASFSRLLSASSSWHPHGDEVWKRVFEEGLSIIIVQEMISLLLRMLDCVPNSSFADGIEGCSPETLINRYMHCIENDVSGYLAAQLISEVCPLTPRQMGFLSRNKCRPGCPVAFAIYLRLKCDECGTELATNSFLAATQRACITSFSQNGLIASHWKTLLFGDVSR